MTNNTPASHSGKLVKLLNTATTGAPENTSKEQTAAIAQSFFVLCVATLCSKLADLLSNPKITLSWLMQTIGAPAFAISLIVPVREAGSMIPQIFLADSVDRYASKIRLYQIGLVLQAGSMFAIAAIAFSLEGSVAGWLIVLVVIAFSLARCLCSLVSKAVLGKLIPKTLRGQVTGWSSTAAGLVSCAVALYLLLFSSGRSVDTSLVLLLIACCAWLLSAGVYEYLKQALAENSSGPSSQEIPDKQSWLKLINKQLEPFKQDKDFSRFVWSRALLLGSALVAPYYVLLGSQLSGSSIGILAGLLLASGAAQLVSSAIWGKLSDKSSRTTLIVAGVMVFLTGVLTCTLYIVRPHLFETLWLISGLYFCLEICYQGVRIARKTYVVDMSNDETRVRYVAASNSIIGAILLAAGAVLGALSSIVPTVAIIAMLSVSCLMGALLGRTLREV